MEKRYFELATKEYIDSMFEFKCDSNFFSDYLRVNALYDKSRGLGTTHLFLEEREDNFPIILGFYTLKNTSLVVKTEDDGTRIGSPAIEIAQFATNKDYERQGFGRIMIKNIIATANALTDISAIKYIVLCSVKDSINFYIKNGFKEVAKDKFIPRENWNKSCSPMFMNIVVEC